MTLPNLKSIIYKNFFKKSVKLPAGFFTLSGYGAATLAGNVLYTILNFIYNRLITFSPTN